MNRRTLRYRIRQAIRFRGPWGAVRWLCGRLGHRIVAHEKHLWQALDLGGERPRPALPPGLELLKAGERDVALLEELDTVSPAEGLERLRGGHDLWFVNENGRPVFCCWSFRGRTPAVAAPGGWLTLPPQSACQEDSVTSDRLAADGIRWLIRKSEADNGAALRAGQKAGFQPVAVMDFTRIGPISRTRVEIIEQGIGSFLAEHLDSRVARCGRDD
jgi:hypothetical protein